MEIEQRQAEFIHQFVKEAENARGAEAVAKLIVNATAHSSLFAFSEILSVPNILELHGTEFSKFLDLLRLFAHGTWNDYKSNAAHLPSLEPDQVLKLKQLTVLTLAETAKVLPYDLLMQQLDVSNVRELEDFLINECMYSGIVKGKLDQWRRCFEVQFAAGRDLRPGQLDNMMQTVANWLTTSDNMLLTIQEKINWADTMSELNQKHTKELEEKTEEMKSSIKVSFSDPKITKFKIGLYYSSAEHSWDMFVSYWLAEVTNCKQEALRGHEELSYSESGGVMDYDEDRSRQKRRR